LETLKSEPPFSAPTAIILRRAMLARVSGTMSSTANASYAFSLEEAKAAFRG
jgi:hypothetical protein